MRKVMCDNFLIAIQDAINFKNFAVCKLKPEIMKEFEEKYKTANMNAVICKQGSDIKTVFKMAETQGYILTIFMFLFLMYKNLSSSDFYDLENLWNLLIYSSGTNTYISSLLMDYDFANNENLDFEAFYMPSVCALEYVGAIYRNQRFIKSISKNTKWYKVLKNFEEKSLIREYDKLYLGTLYAFMELQATLLIMAIGRPYSEAIQKIARQILVVFKDVLVNARIEKIIIDPAIASKAERSGFKKTTGIKIFFALENMDNYCLRIDFPHEGEEYFHYNIHEPGRTTAIPLKPVEYRALVKKYGALSELFFEYEGKFWFRNNFLKRLDSKYDCDNYLELNQELKKLFHDKAHYQMFAKDIKLTDMKQFIAEFGTALSHMNFGEFVYESTDQDNIDIELQKMKLQEVVYDAMMQQLEISVFEDSDDACVAAKKTLKSEFIEILFRCYSNVGTKVGTREECLQMDLNDIFESIFIYCMDS